MKKMVEMIEKIKLYISFEWNIETQKHIDGKHNVMMNY